MLQYRLWQKALIIGAVVLAALFAAPSFFPKEQVATWPGFLPKSRIALGLDLQGGSYLLLGVDTEKVIDDRLVGMRQELQRSMRPQGARQRVALEDLPTLNAAGDLISLRVRDAGQIEEASKRVRDLTRGGGLIGAGVRPYEVTVEGNRIDVVMHPEAKRAYAQEALADSIEVVRRRIDPAGNKEVLIQAQGQDRIVVQAPGDNDPEALKQIINRTGQLSFHRVDTAVSPTDAQAGILPPGRMVTPIAETEGGGQLVLWEEAEVSGDMVESASAGVNDEGGGFQINFSFDQRGARRFAAYTQEHIGELFAIVLDGEVISYPRIQSAITGGSGRITGNFAPEEAQRIATLIRSGALPAPLTTLDQRSIGPGLGADSVRAGGFASLIAFSLVVVFMLVTYGLFGVFATIALVANVVLIFGVLSLLGSTMTLPGIAGIVLTIGMAVDANVLIYERIREELANGKAPIVATEIGFDKALSAIADSNITTLLAAWIMLMLGAGPVRGFALTLAVGVVTSVFSAIVITRLIAGGYLLSKRPKTITL
ncbi:MAG: protein translocase subunit SecD [Parvularculaceae bacterium]|nr:protein translocase subunit SecD [Parvularculaceae bacterium]